MPETDLNTLIRYMNPSTDGEDYVFCTSASLGNISLDHVVSTFQEKEGLTLILKKEIADRYGLPYNGLFCWITLNIESSLEAVGLTAKFSEALTSENISCNVIAGYYHDHIFVPKGLLQKSLETLRSLSKTH